MSLDAFKQTLIEIKKNDSNYDVREKLVYRALHYASELGFECGIRFDKPAIPPEFSRDEIIGRFVDDMKWPVVCIKLPTGEVSWHCPAYGHAYDGYETDEKYRRADEFCAWYGASM